MATWIAHVRVAEQLYAVIPGLDEAAFIFGNLAPDSGKPNADWTEFDPPKHITHFQHPGEDEDKIADLAFYRDYLLTIPSDDAVTTSFAWGYFFHLLCDNLWIRLIWATTKVEYAAELEANNKFIWAIKQDWYGLDHKYLRDHPDCSFWRVFAALPTPVPPFPFLNADAFQHSMNYIRAGYTAPAPERVLDRAYPHLQEAVMDRYVADAAARLLEIYTVLQTQPILDGKQSALTLLTTPLLPYPAPLGDIVEDIPYER